jgi:hypothetical protein
VSGEDFWGWAILFVLGAYHGINPGMGWLFAVALGMQEKRRSAVWWALLPIALGHGLAIGAVVLLAGLIQTLLPLGIVKILVALSLFSLGAYRLKRSRHPRWGGMQVGTLDLTIWSFLMASAHGAGFMVLPILFGMSAGSHVARHGSLQHPVPSQGFVTPLGGVVAVVIHTLGYLLFTGLVAVLVYEKLGLALLRKAWFNLDLLWGIALLLTGVLTLLW